MFSSKNEEVNKLKTGDKIKAASAIVLCILMVLTIVATNYAKQLKTDRETDQLTLFDPRDPFMGGK